MFSEHYERNPWEPSTDSAAAKSGWQQFSAEF